MGSAMFELGEVLGSRGNVKAKKLKQGGTIFIRATPAPTEDTGRFLLKLQGHKLKNVDGLFSKSDPFVEISSKINSASGLTWQPVFRSKHIDNDLNPQWEEIDISMNKLCQGDQNAPILISVYDWEKSGKHKPMGSFETSVTALCQSVVPAGTGKTVDTSKAYSLFKSGKSYGKVLVTWAKVSGPVPTGHAPPPPVPTYSSTMPPAPVAAASTASAVAAGVVAGQDNTKVPSFGSLPVQIAPSVIPAGRPTFVDYLTGGLELQMLVAIDFTGSNGDPRQPGTLHHIKHDGSLNDYEKAITAVGAVVARYDTDQKFPVMGFGAKFGGVIQHCFQVGVQPEVNGISGILDGYRNVFKTGLTMSGPTIFEGVITTAANQARQKQAQNARIGQMAYHILLILTDGAVSDVEGTKRAIVAASDAPLSIIIVGIGNADFSTMQFLDDFCEQEGVGRDICQFVEFSRHQHNRQNLTKETLDEVPDQVVDYFYDSQGIMPLPALSGSKFSIMEAEHNPGEDVEINLEFSGGQDGEITIGNPSAGRYDDTTYDTYAGYAPSAPMAQPVASPQVFQVQVPPNGYSGMQLQVQNPFTRQNVTVTVPPGVTAGQTFAVA